MFGLFLPWVLDAAIPLWPFLAGAVLILWAVVAPASLAHPYVAWMRLGLALGKITTPLVLGLVFYLLVFPMGMVMRLFGYDPLHRKLDAAADSYRILRDQEKPGSMEHPF